MNLRKLIDKSLDKAEMEYRIIALISEIKNFPITSPTEVITDFRVSEFKSLYERYRLRHGSPLNL